MGFGRTPTAPKRDRSHQPADRQLRGAPSPRQKIETKFLAAMVPPPQTVRSSPAKPRPQELTSTELVWTLAAVPGRRSLPRPRRSALEMEKPTRTAADWETWSAGSRRKGLSSHRSRRRGSRSRPRLARNPEYSSCPMSGAQITIPNSRPQPGGDHHGQTAPHGDAQHSGRRLRTPRLRADIAEEREQTERRRRHDRRQRSRCAEREGQRRGQRRLQRSRPHGVRQA